MPISNKGILKPIVFVIVFLLAVVIGGIVFWQYPEMQDENIKNNEGTVKTEKDIETSVLGENKEEATDWKIYRNEEYKFEIEYPKEWTIKEEIKEDAGIKEYRLDIFYPENIREANIYENVAIKIFECENNDEFFEQELDSMKKDFPLTVKKTTRSNVKGFRSVLYNRTDKIKSTSVSEIFQREKGQGIFRIYSWTIDLDKEVDQEQIKSILSTFKFLD